MMNKKIALAMATALSLVSTSNYAVEKLYCSGDEENASLDDLDSFSITIPVADSGKLTDIDVELIYTHEWPGDQVITISHASTESSLIDQLAKPGGAAGSCSADITENDGNFLVLDDEAGTSIQTQCPPQLNSTQSFKPNQPLTAFDGKEVNGDWTITFTDVVEEGEGSFIMACLRANFEDDPGPTPTPGDFNNDGKLTVFDLAKFKEWFTDGDSRADLDNNGGVNLFDLAKFRQYWNDANSTP